jgi:uncharacterized protein (DUF885 family)
MMRRLVLLAALGLALAGAFLVPTLWGKPWSIDHFFARVFLEFALERPLVLSQLRILEPWGIDFHADDLDDFSLEFERDELREAKRNLELLRSYDRDSLSASQRLSADVLEWFLATEVAGEPFLLHDYPVNQLNGIQHGLPEFMLNVHQLNEPEDAVDYNARLARFGVAMDQVTQGLAARRRAGNVPPRFVLGLVRDDIAAFLERPPEEHFLYRHLAIALDHMDALAAPRRDELLAGARQALAQEVLPGYRRLDAALAELEGEAGDEAGVQRLPDGEAYYAWQLRRHTTTALGAEEIHQLGLREVARIRREMQAALAEQGLPGDDPIAAVRALSRDPRYLYPEGDAGREAILADYQRIIDEAWSRLPALVGRLPAARVSVLRVPESMQGGGPLAYYDPPPFDGSRPGVFYANLRDVRENVKFRMRTLAYHEAVPGHHLQVALAMEARDVPFFRRVMPFTAFTEGWALYAERLAAEQGLQPTPADRLGMLVDQMFRAARLVVDTGIHAKGWSRGRAIAYMQEQTGKPLGEVVSEVDRYVVLPGQACAYMVGQLEILRLREEAQRRLGERFDLRAFHDVVLGGGALPLSILERQVGAWIDAQEERG